MYHRDHHHIFLCERCKLFSLFPHKSTLISLKLLMRLLLLKRIFFATQTEIMSLQKNKIAVQFIINRTFQFYCPSLELFSSQLQLCVLVLYVNRDRVYLAETMLFTKNIWYCPNVSINIEIHSICFCYQIVLMIF